MDGEEIAPPGEDWEKAELRRIVDRLLTLEERRESRPPPTANQQKVKLLAFWDRDPGAWFGLAEAALMTAMWWTSRSDTGRFFCTSLTTSWRGPRVF